MTRCLARRPHWPLAIGLAAGVALDALLGDPRRGHPVAAFGRAAAALEARDYADSRPRGAAHAAACILAAAAPAALVARGTRARPPWQAAAAASRSGRSPAPVRYIVKPNGSWLHLPMMTLLLRGAHCPASAAGTRTAWGRRR